jgi:flagellar hook-associated protein 3 FlgL
MRDILRGLATVGALSGSQVGAGGFTALVQDTNASLAGAVAALNQDAGVLGDRQTALEAQSTEIGQVSTALQTQLSGVQDVDMTSTLSALTQVQTQLQASYQLIAQAKGMTLAQYLTA